MYICNMTGKEFDISDDDKHREGGSVEPGSASFIRHRAIYYALTKELYGNARCLSEVQKKQDDTGYRNVSTMPDPGREIQLH